MIAHTLIGLTRRIDSRSQPQQLGRLSRHALLVCVSPAPPVHSAPPRRSSGAAYSSTTGCGATARASTTSCAPIPSGHSSARAHTTSAFSIPRRRATRSMNAHLRAWLSTSLTWLCGSAIASGKPGNPAPAPISAIRPAPAQLLEFERHKRIGEVHVDSELWLAHGRGRKLVGSQRQARTAASCSHCSRRDQACRKLSEPSGCSVSRETLARREGALTSIGSRHADFT